MTRNPKFRFVRIGAFCAALCLGLAVHAQTGTGTGTGTSTSTGGTGTGMGAGTGGMAAGSGATGGTDRRNKDSMPRADVAFMKQAAENNFAEIESSKLALTKATEPKVKAFAQQMVEEHEKTGKELAALAGAKGVELPDGPSLMQKGKLKLLSTADGADFDRRYSETMGIAAHRANIELFQKAAKQGRDPDVKAFASKTLPALQHHLEMAGTLPSGKDSRKGSANAKH